MGDLRHLPLGDHHEPIDGEQFVDGEVIDDLEGQEGGMDDESFSEGGEDGDGEASAHHAILEDDSIHSFEGHADAVLAVAWSPAHPDLVATGGQDDRAFMWRVGHDAYESTAGTLSTCELAGHTDSVISVAFNARGTLLATGGMDGIVKVWYTSNGQLVQSLEGPGSAIEWVKWHPKGDVVLAGTDDFTLWMWLAQTGACMQVFSGHHGPVTSGAFTADGKTVISTGGEDDASLRAWNPKTGECIATISGHPFHEAGITCSAVHADCATVLTGAEDGSVRVSNVTSNRVLGSLTGHEDSVEAVGFSHLLPLAATAGVDGKMFIWDCGTLTQRGICEHPDVITRMAWHPTQPLVFTCCTDNVVRCWDLRTASVVHQYGGHAAAVQDLAISPDGSMLISGSDDHTAKVFRTVPQ